MCILIQNCQPKWNSTYGAYRITDYNSFFTRLFFQQPSEIIFSTIFHQLRVGVCIYNASPTQAVSSTKFCSIKIHLPSFISYKALLDHLPPRLFYHSYIILRRVPLLIKRDNKHNLVWPYSSSAGPLTFYLGLRRSPTKTLCISVGQRFFFNDTTVG